MATNKRSTPSHLELSDEIRVGGAAPLTDRVNVEPAILNGMTTTEAQIIGAISFAFCVAIGGLLVAMFGKWQILLIVSLFCPLVILWFASKKLAQVKRNRPDGYYAQAIHLWAARKGLTKNKFIEYEGFWGLGRSLEFGFWSPFEVTESEEMNQPKAGQKIAQIQNNALQEASKK